MIFYGIKLLRAKQTRDEKVYSVQGKELRKHSSLRMERRKANKYQKKSL